MSTPILEVKGVSLSLSGKEILHNISFNLESNEDLVIFGPNGAGKTLLLMLLSGNLDPTSGEIFIYGQPLHDRNSFEIKKQIGFVSPKIFEDYDYHSKVTDVVMSGLFGSIGIGNDPTKDNSAVVRKYINRVIAEKYNGSAKAEELLHRLHVHYLKGEIFGHLSYGEKVRVLIARALISSPKLFILDEPTTGLDLKMRAEFIKVVEELAGQADIVYVTHYVEEVLPEFTKILLLKNGNVFKYGNKSDLLTNQTLSDLLDAQIHVDTRNGKYFAWF